MSAEAAVERAVGGASPRVQRLFRQAIKLYGLDPADPAYLARKADGSSLCRVCQTHGETTKRLACDLEMARAREMEGLGFRATFCHSCRQAFPLMFAQSSSKPHCATCARIARFPLNGYASDGVGCVEKQSISERQWDSRPVAASRRAW